MNDEIATRLAFARSLVDTAGAEALSYFRSLETLEIEQKGHQDLVSDADRNVEILIREAISATYPGDGIIGEEFDNVASSSGFTWVIDPIDGTANFVHGIPAWTVVLACVHDGETRIGVIGDPIHKEVFSAAAGHGAFVGDKPIRVAQTEGFHDGSIAIGYSNRRDVMPIIRFCEALVAEGGIFIRNASGALSLAYVAAGRVNGYCEEHMNAWDCIAGQLLIREAGGRIEDQDIDEMLAEGGRVVAATPAIFDQMVQMADAAFSDGAV